MTAVTSATGGGLQICRQCGVAVPPAFVASDARKCVLCADSTNADVREDVDPQVQTSYEGSRRLLDTPRLQQVGPEASSPSSARLSSCGSAPPHDPQVRRGVLDRVQREGEDFG